MSEVAMQNFNVGFTMGTKQFKCEVACPTVEDFAKLYPQYAPFAMTDGRELFDLIIQPENFVRMSTVSDLGHAALYGVATPCSELAKAQNKPLTSYTKQFIGAVVCCLMEFNNYQKTGRKKAVNHPDFTKGEIYSRESRPNA